MMLAFQQFDYLQLFLFVGAVLGLGLYACRGYRDVREFYFSDAKLGTGVAALSVAMTLLTGLGFLYLPANAYDEGWFGLWPVLGIWIGLPLAMLFAPAMYFGLKVSSVYEYLELRFDRRLRTFCAMLFLVWRVAWLAIVLSLPAMVIGSRTTTLAVTLILGVVVTTIAALGGVRLLARMSASMGAVLFVGCGLLLSVVIRQSAGPSAGLSSGLRQVFQLAEKFQRDAGTSQVDGNVSMWGIALIVAAAAVVTLAHGLADQVTVQRLLATGTARKSRWAMLLGFSGVTAAIMLFVFAGFCLLAYFHAQPHKMRPIWVVNVDSTTRQTYYADGVEAIDWETDITADNLPLLVEQGRVLQPNNKLPFEVANGLIDPVEGRIHVERLAVRKSRTGEFVMNDKARLERWPHLWSRCFPLGGLFLILLYTVTASSVDAGLHALGQTWLAEFHHRYGWGRRFVQPDDESDEVVSVDQRELRLSRIVIAVAGGIVTTLAVIATLVPIAAMLVAASLCSVAAVLAAVFLLGMLSRRATATAVFWLSLLVVLAGVPISFATTVPLSSGDFVLYLCWPIVISFVAVLVGGRLLSLFVGTSKTRQEAQGLVVGIGKPGFRSSASKPPAAFPPVRIPRPAGSKDRWKE